jgi:hypothetical protein
LLDAFSAMFLVTENAAAYARPEYDAVAMDVLLRRFEEFQTVMPVLPTSTSLDKCSGVQATIPRRPA